MASQLDSHSDAARLQILATSQQQQPGSRSAGSRVDARSCVEPGTGLGIAGAWVLCLFVCAFLVLEYAWRRWRLRHVPHLPLPIFLARLARRWPSLLRSLAGGDR